MPDLRWALRSPGRLAAVVLAVVLVLALAAQVGSHSRSRSEAPAFAPPSAPPAGTDVAPVPVASTPTADPAVPVIAYRFLTAWARPTLPRAQWYAGVRSVATPRLSGLLYFTDPSRIPARRLTGYPTVDTTAPQGVTRVQIATDGGPVDVTLMPAGPGSASPWLVDRVEPAESRD